MAPADRTLTGAAPTGSLVRLGRFFYRYRSYTPLPLVAVLIFASRPTAVSLLAGAPLLLAGESVRLGALRRIGGASRSIRIGGTDLAVAGVYSLTRNPLYLGNALLSTGIAILSGIGWLPPLTLLLLAVQYVPIIASEEEELARRFGEKYEVYRRRVPPFLPALRRALPAEPLLTIADAVRCERRTLSSIGIMLLILAARTIGRWGG